MNNKDKLLALRALVVSANQKKMSDLTLEQKHAVMLFGTTFPAAVKEGKLQYDRSSGAYAMSPVYKDFNAYAKQYEVPCRGLSARSSWVEVDEIPVFKEVMSLATALDAYPNELLIIPREIHHDKLFSSVKTTFSDADAFAMIATLAFHAKHGEANEAICHLITNQYSRVLCALEDHYGPYLRLGKIDKSTFTPKYDANVQERPQLHPDKYINALAWAVSNIQVQC